MSRSPLAAQRAGRSNWRTATKQQILGNFSQSSGAANKSSSKIDGSNIHHVRMVIDGMQEKHDQMVAFLKSDLEDNKLEQEECLSTGLIKLPRAIRNMSVRDFNRQHNCDLLALLKSKDGVIPTTNANLIPMKRNFNTVMATPAVRPRNPANQSSVLRTARKGEGLYSQNGSPLETYEKGSVIATVAKKRRGNGDTANFEINVGDGKFISLNDPSGVQELDSNMRATAATQLKVLQDQMASLMAQLQN